MEIQVFSDAGEVARAAARAIAAAAREAVAARGRFLMAVSGGRTPWEMLRALRGEDVPWAGVQIFQVDERIAPPGDPDRNLTHLRECLSGVATLPASHIHPMPVEESDPERAAALYSQTLHDTAGAPPVLDFVHLGLGADGHTASLIPGDPVLEVLDREVAVTGVYQKRRRLTLTYPVLNRARRILWVVTGGEKAEMLVRLRGADPSIPGGRVEQLRARVFADREASVGLGTAASGGRVLRVGLATDHGGFGLKADLAARITSAGHELVDFGAHRLDAGDDYPDYIIPLAQAVAEGRVDRGIALCGSGVGAAVCANKVRGVRASLIHEHFSARQGVEDDDMNVLCIGGRTVGPEVAWDLAQTFLQSRFSGATRHVRRLAKVQAMESGGA